MDIQKELKGTTEILDSIVPFQPNNKTQIMDKIEDSHRNRLKNRSSFRYKIGAMAAAAVLCLTAGFSFSPIAAPYKEQVYKLFFKGNEVSTVKNHDSINRKIDTTFNIDEELEKIRANVQEGEAKAVYIREANPGAQRPNGKPYNLVTVINKPVSTTDRYQLVHEIQNKTIAEDLTYGWKEQDLSGWRKGEDVNLPLSSIDQFQFNKGNVSYVVEDFDKNSLVDEARKTGKNIVIRDAKLTNLISSLWLEYKKNDSNFNIRLSFGEAWKEIQIPDLDKAKEVTKFKIGENEALYVEIGTSKGVFWVENTNGKITQYNLNSDNLSKAEMMNICNNLF